MPLAEEEVPGGEKKRWYEAERSEADQGSHGLSLFGVSGRAWV